MKKHTRVLLLAAVLAFSLLLTGCCMSHQWTAATCDEPQTCSECGKTKGEALGHQWLSATCLEPEICAVCGAAQGEALGHAPGEWTVSYDILSCEAEKQQLCSRCGEATATETEALTSFIADGAFVFTPEEYLQKLVSIPEGWYTYQDGPIEYTFREDSENLEAIVTYQDMTSLILFYKAGDVPMAAGEAQATGIQRIRYCEITDSNTLYQLAFDACDPLMEDGLLVPMSILYAKINGVTFEYHGITYNDPDVSGAEIGYSQLDEVRSYDIIVLPAA